MSKAGKRGERRVVVTGVGLLTPVGNDLRSSWEALLAGQSGAGPISQFEATEEFATRIACEVKGFDPSRYLEAKEIKRNDRFVQFAIAVADEAMGMAGLREEADRAGVPPARFGVLFGSGIGGMYTFEEQCRILISRGAKRVSPFFVPMFIPDMASGMVSIRYGAQGPNYATVSACASSAHAVGDALRILQRGDADVMLAGGTDRFLGWVLGGFVLAILHSVVLWKLSAQWMDLATFGVLIVILLFRPRGILGLRRRLEEVI